MNLSIETNTDINNSVTQIRRKENSVNRSFPVDLSSQCEKSEVDANLEYYYSLCKEFPGITFRLEDIQTALKQNAMGKISLGYNGSMHQVGENFAGIGQCSIEIDISVISRMRTDKNYETAAKWMIKDSRDRFPEYMTEVPEEPYVAVCLEDVNGKIQRSRMHSSVRIPTEEELQEKLGLDSSDALKLDPDKMTDDLINTYLQMLEKSEQKRKELLDKNEEKQAREKDITDKTVEDEEIMNRASNRYSLNFIFE